VGADYPDPDNLAKAFADYTIKQLAYRNTWYDASNFTKMAAKELDTSKRLASMKNLPPMCSIMDPTQYVTRCAPIWSKNVG